MLQYTRYARACLASLKLASLYFITYGDFSFGDSVALKALIETDHIVSAPGGVVFSAQSLGSAAILRNDSGWTRYYQPVWIARLNRQDSDEID